MWNLDPAPLGLRVLGMAFEEDPIEEDPDAIVIVLDGAEARLLVWALKHARPHARKRQRALMAELAEALVSGIDKAAADETNVEGA